MRKQFLVLPLLLLGAAACSQNSQDNVGNSLDRTGDAIANATDDVGETLDNAAGRAGDALANTGDSIANAVDKGASNFKDSVSGKSVDRDDWVGRWKGVEGTYLVISKGADPATYKLEMQYTLDDKGKFDGRGTSAGIAFKRPDGEQTLRATDGNATGLKYLAGKKHCLTVKSGEGYCKD